MGDESGVVPGLFPGHRQISDVAVVARERLLWHVFVPRPVPLDRWKVAVFCFRVQPFLDDARELFVWSSLVSPRHVAVAVEIEASAQIFIN